MEGEGVGTDDRALVAEPEPVHLEVGGERAEDPHHDPFEAGGRPGEPDGHQPTGQSSAIGV